MLRALLVVVMSTTGCGRIGFDPRGTGDDVVDDAAGDTVADDSPASDPSLQLHIVFESSVDDVAKGRPVNCMGSCPVFETGRASLAGRFDGAECLVVGNAPEFETQSFTVALWFRAFDNGDYSIFSKPRGGATSFDNSFELWKDPAGEVMFSSSGNVLTPVGGTSNDLAWHHAAATYFGGQIRTYLDGALQTSASSVTSYAGDAVLVGCDIDVGMVLYHFRGHVDDLRFYDRALMAAEVAALAQ